MFLPAEVSSLFMRYTEGSSYIVELKKIKIIKMKLQNIKYQKDDKYYVLLEMFALNPLSASVFLKIVSLFQNLSKLQTITVQ